MLEKEKIVEKRDFVDFSKNKNETETYEYSKFLLESENLYELIVELNRKPDESVIPYIKKEGLEIISSSSYNSEDNIKANLISIKKKPIFIYKDTMSQINGVNCNSTFNEKIKTLIADVPIKEKDIITLAYACNYLKVIVGTYGSLDDKNYSNKLKELYKIKKIFEKISSNEIICNRNFKSKDMYMEYVTNRIRKK